MLPTIRAMPGQSAGIPTRMTEPCMTPPPETSELSTSATTREFGIARAAAPDKLRWLARHHDWREGNETVIGWIMAQKGIDLGTALTVFFNGGPERFNYLSKHEVPPAHQAAARLLDTICLRINSGFYRLRPGQKVGRRARVRNWLAYQQADRAEGRRGRWVLDEAMIEAALKGRAQQAGPSEPGLDALRGPRGAGARRKLLSRLARAGLGRFLRRPRPRRGETEE